MDPVSEQRLSQIHAALAAKARQLCALASAQSPQIVIRVTQGLRTFEEQGALYDQGRIKPGTPCTHNGQTWPVGTCKQHPYGLVVTNAKPGQSWHNFGLAFDVAVDALQHSPVFVPDWNATHPTWRRLIQLGQQIGLDCGALWRTFPDTPHFELTGKLGDPGLPSPMTLMKYQAGGIAAVWAAAEITA